VRGVLNCFGWVGSGFGVGFRHTYFFSVFLERRFGGLHCGVFFFLFLVYLCLYKFGQSIFLNCSEYIFQGRLVPWVQWVQVSSGDYVEFPFYPGP
jgi:hypothetical protein